MRRAVTQLHRQPGRARAPAPYAAINTYLEQQVRRLRIPGASLTIVEGDRLAHARGFGAARPGGAAPSPQTPFVLGSITKSFTALAVMQLAEAGKVDLDAPVQRYLPWFHVADAAASARMTVRQLLNQTSGLPGVPGMENLANLDSRPEAAEDQARALAPLQLSHAPGTAFEYSNLNYNLLGLIIETASGEGYQGYIERHIFAPLHMRHSYTAQDRAKRDGLAMGHRYWFGRPQAMPHLPTPRGSLASGQLIASAEDMAHYLIAQLNRGRYGTTQILSADGIDELHRAAVECRALGATVGWYGMGWFSAAIGPTRICWHGGNVPDFSSFMAILPEQRRGVILLVNADHYGLPFILAEVGMGVAALLAGQGPPPIRLGLIPWLMRALPLIPLLQLVDIAATLRLRRRWRQNPALRPPDGQRWARHILPALTVHLGLAALPAIIWARGLLRFLLLFTPDLAWVALLSGSLATVWAPLRSALLALPHSAPRPPRTPLKDGAQ